MIYLEQRFNIEPASPLGRDRFIELAEKALVPAWSRAGGRLMAAWFGTEEWFYQVTHIVAFEDLATFETARNAIAEDAEFASVQGELDTIAPVRRESLLECLGAVSSDKLDAAIAASADEPAGIYSLAILEVAPGKMEDFKKLLTLGAANLPIIASWRDVAGNPNQVIDVWTGDPGGHPYSPSSDGMEAFFGPLRQLAPKERTVRLYPLPYSPLR